MKDSTNLEPANSRFNLRIEGERKTFKGIEFNVNLTEQKSRMIQQSGYMYVIV